MAAPGPATFLNFETAPVHPVALGPDGRTLAVCNLPDYRVELFDVSSGSAQPIGGIPVGMDPVSLRWRTANELWVVNHISSSVNVVDVARRLIVATLQTKAGPSDVVFAGNPTRAYVSCSRENEVQVFDPISHELVNSLSILGDRPKSLGVSPDGSKVYVAIFESGNASTILAPKLTPLDVTPPPSVVSDPEGPHRGQDPPPNHGAGFNPPMSPYLNSNALPRGSLIVKKDGAGRWKDDNQGDWTEFVSGAKASRSGRVTGWDMPDRDLAIIDTASGSISYATGLMNLCMSLAVNPVSGEVAVVGTDGRNEVRFEPVLRGVFLRVSMALVNPETMARRLVDLNPHLDYSVQSVPVAQRARSIGDPRGVVWNAAGTKAYVTGMGSGNLIVVDAAGRRLQESSIELEDGPTGLALDESRGRLYVLNRFSASVSTVDLNSLTVVGRVAFYDPTPSDIKAGRRLFYNTRNSGLGHVSCASCHPDGRQDRLAWDLGIPNGEMFNLSSGAITNFFHPMKGPMVTRTLQEPEARDQGKRFLHWRGDRPNIVDFHVTFPDLLGSDQAPSVAEMRDMTRLFASIALPPNRFRTLDNRLPDRLPLPGLFGVRDSEGVSAPLPPGNANRGFELFKRVPSDPAGNLAEIRRNACSACHDCESGKGLDIFRVFSARSDGLPFLGASLRGLEEKMGFDLEAKESRAGFGFLHDGRTDTLTRFLSEGFEIRDPQEIADLTAFLLCFSGSEMPDCNSEQRHLVMDGPAVTGKQLTLTKPGTSEELERLFAAASRSGSQVDFLKGDQKPSEFVVRGIKAGVNRSWWRDLDGQYYEDRNGILAPDVLSLASAENPLTFTAVPYGVGRRVGIDRDDDGLYDRTEAEQGSDPLDVHSPSQIPPEESQDYYGEFHVVATVGKGIDVPLESVGRWRGPVFGPLHPNNTFSFEFMNLSQVPPGMSLQAGGTRLVWEASATLSVGYRRLDLVAHDNARPNPGFADLYVVLLPPVTLQVQVNPYPPAKMNSDDTELRWEPLLGYSRYEVYASEAPGGPWKMSASLHDTSWYDRSAALGRPRRFYRVVAIPD